MWRACRNYYKLDGRTTKAVFREAFADIIPAEVQRGAKKGFGVPIDAWYRTEPRDYLRDNRLGPSARLGSYVDQGYVNTLVNQHLEHRANHGHRLWTPLTLERWLAPQVGALDGGGWLRGRLAAGGDDVTDWTSAVREFQRMHREGEQRVTFFINMAPVTCQTEDRFHDGGSIPDDDALQAIRGQDTPVASTTRAILHYRPSQMSAAGGHALGNANRVKADVLAEYLQSTVLPSLLNARPR